MMTTRSCSFRTVLVALLLGLLVAPMAAQVGGAGEESGQLELTYIHPKHANLNGLFQLVGELYGRDVQLADGRKTRNLMLGNGAILVHEVPERLKEIQKAIAKLDVAVPVTQPKIEMRLYRPKHTTAAELALLAGQVLTTIGGSRQLPRITAHNEDLAVHASQAKLPLVLHRLKALDEALKSDVTRPRETLFYEPRSMSTSELVQALHILRPRQPGSGKVLQVTTHDKAGLMLRGTEAQVEEAKQLLAKIDRPSPQVMLSAYVLIGSDKAGQSPDPELEEALREVLPYRHYQVHAASVVRVAAEPRRSFSIQLNGSSSELGNQARYVMNGVIAAYDRDLKALKLERLGVTAIPNGGGNRQLFDTSTTIFGGEYAVLGVAGGEPVFVVIRLRAVSKDRARVVKQRKPN